MPKIRLSRGDIVLVDLRGAEGVEKAGIRPCVVIQNNGGNASAPFTVIVPVTDASAFKGYPSQVLIQAVELGPGTKDSVVECGHPRTIDRDFRIVRRLGQVTAPTLVAIDLAIQAGLGLVNPHSRVRKTARPPEPVTPPSEWPSVRVA